jgi:hypothetical protein
VDGLACPLHRPTAYNCQMRGQGLLSGIILSRHCSRWWHLCEDVKPLGLGYLVESWSPGYLCYQVLHGVYCFTMICLPYVKVIMAFMRVPLAELPFETEMGWIPALVWVLSSVCGLLQSHPFSLDDKCYRLPSPYYR